MCCRRSLLSHLLKPIYLRSVVVSLDPFDFGNGQLDALHRALVGRLPIETPQVEFSSLSTRVLLCRRQYPLGKCSTEETHFELATAKDRRSPTNDKDTERVLKPLQPFELSINWILLVEAGSSTGQRLFAGGTVEVTLSRTGIPQGSSLKNKNSVPARNVDSTAHHSDMCKGLSRLCSRC